MPDLIEHDDTLIIVCVPVKACPAPSIIGCVERVCSECQCPVWLAPASARTQREKGAAFMCLECFYGVEVVIV